MEIGSKKDQVGLHDRALASGGWKGPPVDMTNDAKGLKTRYEVKALSKQFSGLCLPCVVGMDNNAKHALIWCPCPDKAGRGFRGAAHDVMEARATWEAMSPAQRRDFGCSK